MSKMKMNYIATTKACLALFRIKTAEGFQYRLSGIAGSSTSIFWVLIEITVYTVFYRYSDHKSAGLIAGLNLKQLITYSWLAQVLIFMQPMSIDSEILRKITTGDVGIEMCRPLDLYSHWFAKTAATRLTPIFWRGSMVILVGLIMPASYRFSPPASLPGLFCMFLSLVGAFLLCTSFGMFVCAVRLNVTWGDGPTYIIMLIGGVLSGGYLPLQLWPEFMQKFLLLQPFAGYLDIPLRLYLGVLAPNNALWTVGLQILWSVTFIIIGKRLMTLRLRNIIVQGG